jgi:hypothetical protein
LSEKGLHVLSKCNIVQATNLGAESAIRARCDAVQATKRLRELCLVRKPTGESDLSERTVGVDQCRRRKLQSTRTKKVPWRTPYKRAESAGQMDGVNADDFGHIADVKGFAGAVLNQLAGGK